MKAVRLHDYHKPPVVEDVPEPTLSGPLDVIVKIGGPGLPHRPAHHRGPVGGGDEPEPAVHDRPRERRLGALGRRGRHQTWPPATR